MHIHRLRFGIFIFTPLRNALTLASQNSDESALVPWRTSTTGPLVGFVLSPTWVDLSDLHIYDHIWSYMIIFVPTPSAKSTWLEVCVTNLCSNLLTVFCCCISSVQKMELLLKELYKDVFAGGLASGWTGGSVSISLKWLQCFWAAVSEKLVWRLRVANSHRLGLRSAKLSTVHCDGTALPFP